MMGLPSWITKICQYMQLKMYQKTISTHPRISTNHPSMVEKRTNMWTPQPVLGHVGHLQQPFWPSLRSLSPAVDRLQKGLTWADPALDLAMVLGCVCGGAHEPEESTKVVSKWVYMILLWTHIHINVLKGSWEVKTSVLQTNRMKGCVRCALQ